MLIHVEQWWFAFSTIVWKRRATICCSKVM